jgi:hypothetical protein
MVALLACALVLSTGIIVAQSPAAREYQVKAVFLFNFIQFVEWPGSAFLDVKSPVKIGILGEDPFDGALDEAVKGEKIAGRSVEIVRSRRPEDLAGCHLVFISRSEGRRVERALAQLSARPVLTVSELEGFTHQGGMIAFYSEGKKIRFEINPATAKSADLKISSELLGLGRIAGPDPRKEGRDLR